MEKQLIHSDRDNNKKKTMKISLLKGRFTAKDAEELLSMMIQIKIRYHESKINSEDNEEDIKMRERRIRELQNDLYEVRKYISQNPKEIDLQAEISY